MDDDHFEMLCKMSDEIQDDIEDDRRDLCEKCEFVIKH